jgi:predicted DsbA family dithiol-disulfide isomerase
MVEACGYTYAPHPEIVPNSHKALELTELARDEGVHEPFHTRVLDAYWAESRDIGDEAVLLELAADVGLDPGKAVAALADGRYRDRIASSTREANALGIHAIPAFVLDSRALLVGAYPHEVFERAFAQLAQAEESRP